MNQNLEESDHVSEGGRLKVKLRLHNMDIDQEGEFSFDKQSSYGVMADIDFADGKACRFHLWCESLTR